MPRITIDLDASALHELERRARASRTTVDRLASELLTAALREHEPPQPVRFEWHTAPMGARLDPRDDEALNRALDGRRPT